MNESVTASGEPIPDFSLPASTGQTLSLDSFLGKVPLAIVFVVGLEPDRELLASLNEHLAEFGAERSQVMAVANDTAKTVRHFAETEGIVMPILADASGAMARDYGAADAEGAARRVAVVAGVEGELVRRFDPLPVEGAVDGLLHTIRALGSGALSVDGEQQPYTETPEEGY